MSVIIFIIVLSILVIVHEFGHFIMARRSGILVEEFGFGLPPRLIGKKVGETIYSLNLLPFGGFVRLHGENTEESITNPKRAFLNQSKKVRIKVIVAGVVMNFLLAVVAFAIAYSFSGIPRETENVRVVDVAQDSPARKAGLTNGDMIREVNGMKVFSTKEFIDNVESNKGEEINLLIERAEEKLTVTAFPRQDPPEGQGTLGVVITASEIYFPPIWQRPFYGIYYGFKDAFYWGYIVIVSFGSMIAGFFRGVVPKDIAGPVGIYALTSQAAQLGAITLINFLGILSVNLAILNIMPFPALDGGRLLFIIIESVFGKKVLPKAEAVIHTVGMAILLMLILAITIHDIRRLVAAGGVTQFIDNLIEQQ